MTVNTQMSSAEMRMLEQEVNTFNSQLKEKQQIVSKNSLEESDFLALLITQLKTQDPTKPMDDKEFMGQMAQFTSLKQMSSVAENMAKFTKEFDFSKNVAIIGKEVTWDDGSMERTGIVDSVLVRNGEHTLKSGDWEIKLENVVSVAESGSAIADMVRKALESEEAALTSIEN
ncbi:MAG: flagellar hook capping FlgD N-terminal domain-containing protein [Brevinema sp.]